MATRNCTAEGCQVPTGGSCIEGFDELTECPNFSFVEDENTDIASSDGGPTDQTVQAVDATPGKPALTLSSGEALSAVEGNKLTGECVARVVVLMGMVKSGKSTVLCELFERFCRGPYAGYSFAGSKTIMGFERICYFSRAISNREVEDTDRTKRGTENNLLHLDLVGHVRGNRERLLVSDLSGELFEEAAEMNEKVYAIPYLMRADHIVIFADAERLGDASERQYVLNQLLVLLRCCIEESMIRRTCRLTVAVSRHDLLPSDMEHAFFETMEARIRERAGGYLEEAPLFLNLAARPSSDPADCYGLSELVAGWLNDPIVPEHRVSSVELYAGEAAREIDKFAIKVIGDEC